MSANICEVRPKSIRYPLLLVMFIMACLDIPLIFLSPKLGWLILSIILIIIWIGMSIRYPLFSFCIVLMVFILAYSRLRIGLIDIEGPGNRGGIYVGDLLWGGFAATWLLRRTHFKISLPLVVAFSILPFLAMATVLPLMGVLTVDWPVSYAIPGLRQVQWVSFAFFSYGLARKYSADRVLRNIVISIAVTSVLHFIYGLIQIGYFFGVLGDAWVSLDTIFVRQNTDSWFFYPRATGLLVNPNSYGMFGAFVFVLLLALGLTQRGVGKRLGFWLIMVSTMFSIIFSSSRSALVGLIVAFMFICFVILSGSFSIKLIPRLLKFVSGVGFLTFISLIFLWPLVPLTLRERFLRLLQVFSVGVEADSNAIGRTEMWLELLNLYITKYPFGTWVPPSYATGIAVDSYYVFTAVQGTPLFTLAWLLMLNGVIVLGRRALIRASTVLERASGILLIGWSGVMAGAGLTLSPMLQPHLVVPFWAVIGATLEIRGLREVDNNQS